MERVQQVLLLALKKAKTTVNTSFVYLLKMAYQYLLKQCTIFCYVQDIPVAMYRDVWSALDTQAEENIRLQSLEVLEW